jgi:hypothetical protein
MTIWTGTKEIYSRGWWFMLALPLVALIPFAAEMLQHAAESHVGFYDSFEAMNAKGDDPLRTGFGFLKTVALFLPGYWVPRYVAFDGDGKCAARWNTVAVRLFIPVLLFSVVSEVGQWPVSTLLAGVNLGEIVQTVIGVSIWFGLLVLGIYVTAWVVAAPLGNPHIGFLRSFRIMRGNFWWSFAVTMLALLPLLAVHYAMTLPMIGREKLVLWLFFAIDAALVAYLAIVLAAANYVIARRATARKQIALCVSAAGSA